LNAELADTIGNLLSRASGKSLNPAQKFPKVDFDQLNELIKMESCKVLFEKLSEVSEKCRQHYSQYNFYLVADTIISTLHAANGFFEASKPWELKKSSNENDVRRLETILGITLETLRICGIILQPMVPEFSKRLLDRINIPLEIRYWKDTKLNLPKSPRALVDLGANNILFRKIISDEKTTKHTGNKKEQASK
jgi:methionyl-tRNA synthetase